MAGQVLFGRRMILTDTSEITQGNVVSVLRKALMTHLKNKNEIEYLYAYYKGRQPVLSRKKDVRPEIVNRVVENRANEIVSFKVGYLMGEPIQYVSRGDNEKITENINKLNEFVFAEDKATRDKELADWFHICGTSYRMILPDKGDQVDEAPFEIYTLDPRYSFVVYHNGLGNPPVMGVKYVLTEDGKSIYSVYTRNWYFEIEETAIIKLAPQVLGIPIIEYPANTARLGAFEIVLPLLDAINNTDSNRLDGVEQFIQALMMFYNVDISSEDYAKLRAEGALKVKDIDAQFKAKVEYLIAELDQTQTQTLVDHFYDTVLTICGMPNRNGGTSTSDTGSAVIMRDGWSAAEARAKDSELMFKKSEKEFLKLVLRICRDLADVDLKLANIEIRFTRRNYENITEKANVLTTMLNNEKIHPQLAFSHCGMFIDPEMAYTMSMKYVQERAAPDDGQKKGDDDDGDPKLPGSDGTGDQGDQ